jgi:hypothetical protein
VIANLFLGSKTPTRVTISAKLRQSSNKPRSRSLSLCTWIMRRNSLVLLHDTSLAGLDSGLQKTADFRTAYDLTSSRTLLVLRMPWMANVLRPLTSTAETEGKFSIASLDYALSNASLRIPLSAHAYTSCY